MQDAKRKAEQLEKLIELSRNDATIYQFIELWRRGCFRSFDEMLGQLAVRLATEKTKYLKMAVDPCEP